MKIRSRSKLVSYHCKNAIVEDYVVLLEDRHLIEVRMLLVKVFWRHPRVFLSYKHVPEAGDPVNNEEEHEEKLNDSNSDLEACFELHVSEHSSQPEQTNQFKEAKELKGLLV